MPITHAVRTLLSGIVDYAGLFPPASLSMAEAVREYANQRASRHHWMLARLVVPVSRLVELRDEAAAVRGEHPDDEAAWELSLVATDDTAADAEALRRLQAAQQGAARPLRIASIETKAARVEDVERMLHPLREFVPELYVEVPLDGDLDALVAAIGAAGARAKARLGGVTPQAIPPADRVVRFLATCVRQDVPLKLTAGMHQPIRSERALTYAPDSLRAPMHGFLNVFLAVALLRAGGSEEEAIALVEETDPAAFSAADDAVCWRRRRFDEVTLGSLRRLATSFGSCSFREPVEGLEELGFLSRK